MILNPQTLRGGWNEEGTEDRMGASRYVSLGSHSFIFFTRIPTGRVLGMGLCGWGIVLTAQAGASCLCLRRDPPPPALSTQGAYVACKMEQRGNFCWQTRQPGFCAPLFKGVSSASLFLRLYSLVLSVDDELSTSGKHSGITGANSRQAGFSAWALSLPGLGQSL